MPRAAVVRTSDANKEKTIIAEEKTPKEENSPIGERAITLKPAMSLAALPTRARPHAPPAEISPSVFSPYFAPL